MPKFSAGCHYNKEEISRHLNKHITYWPVQINGNKFASSQILKKPVEMWRDGFELVELKSLPNPGFDHILPLLCENIEPSDTVQQDDHTIFVVSSISCSIQYAAVEKWKKEKTW